MSASYPDILLEYAKNPPNRGKLSAPNAAHFEENRNCGDSLQVQLRISANGIIEEYAFDGKTAIVTTACAAILGEAVIGVSVHEVLGYNYPTIVGFIGSEISHRRRAASVLGLLATRNAIHAYLQDGKTDDFSDVLP